MDIIIDKAWLDANQEEWGGWTLREEGATYILETNVNSPRTAFAIGAENITLDIQDKTISFANRTMQRIWNYAFTPKKGILARRNQGWVLPEDSYIQDDCDYLKRECQVGTSALFIPEMIPDKEYVLTHKSQRTLKAGETYALTWWDDRPRGAVDIDVTIGGLSPVHGPKKDKPGTTTWAIFMPEEDVKGEIVFKFKLQEGEEEGFCRMDNVKLNYSRCHGITTRGSAVHWNNSAPDLPVTSEYTRIAKGFTLKGDKGRIVEGRYGFGDCCVNLRSSKDCIIEGNIYMSIHPRSINDSIGGCIQATYASNIHISTTVRTNNRATSTTTRQGYGGYSIDAGTMQGDNFVGLNSLASPHGVVACSLKKDNNGSMVISGKGETQVRFTNGFFVMAHEGGPESSTIVQDVHISNTGTDNGSRGIHWDGYPEASGYNSINNCHIVTKEIPMNQEYINKGNYPIGGCYGIQIESCANNLIIENNYVEINGDSESCVYRLSGKKDYSEPLKPTATNNTLVSLRNNPSSGAGRASIFKPYRVDGDTLGPHKNNHIIFNDCLVEFEKGNIGNILFEDTTIEYRDEGSKYESAYQIGYRGGGIIEFKNTTFEGPKTWERLTKNVGLSPNLNHIGSDVVVKFTDSNGELLYMVSGNHITKQTHHIWNTGVQ